MSVKLEPILEEEMPQYPPPDFGFLSLVYNGTIEWL